MQYPSVGRFFLCPPDRRCLDRAIAPGRDRQRRASPPRTKNPGFRSGSSPAGRWAASQNTAKAPACPADSASVYFLSKRSPHLSFCYSFPFFDPNTQKGGFRPPLSIKWANFTRKRRLVPRPFARFSNFLKI